MQDIQGIANFLDDLMGGLQLIAYCIAIGSVLWTLRVLRPASSDAPPSVHSIALRLLVRSAWALAITQLVEIVMKGIVIAATLDELPLAYAGTVQFIAGTVRILLAIALGAAAGRVARNPRDANAWKTLYGMSVALIVCGAWLVHAVGRFEYRELLMSITVLHQLAAAVWFGGVAQLVLLWRLSQRDPAAWVFWPQAVARFSILGIWSVAGLLLSGSVLAWVYVGAWDGLVGTGYGSLVITKVILLAVALGLAWLNFRSGKAWKERGDTRDVTTKTPFFIEAESFVLISILFVAATLSSQPPAVDIPNLTATPVEVAQMFMPRIPEMESPSHAELMAGEIGRIAIVNKVPSVAGAQWSNFNHNTAGIFLTTMGILAMLSYSRRFPWAKYWPAGFVGLAIFLFFRSDAETWPMGPMGFWESTFGNGEVLQHRMATFLALGLGVMEVKTRARENLHQRLIYLFPMLCAFGGILLLTHAHSEFELKTEFLIQSTHTVMGLLAVLMATGRWLELRLASPVGRTCGFLSICMMTVIGLNLLFYYEPVW
ncbi:MAG TPA: CopD family protein [Methylococcaceae bacterium]|nr:CopD family protein [Methylococcaceae bacterium]